MYLGRRIRSFSAGDSGILAPGIELKEARTASALEPQVAELPLEFSSVEPVASEVASATESAEPKLAQVERDRLWGLVGLLRRSNARLARAYGRVSKENEALRSERDSEDRLTVASILEGSDRLERADS